MKWVSAWEKQLLFKEIENLEKGQFWENVSKIAQSGETEKNTNNNREK